MRQVVGVVDVAHRACRHRAREVGRPAGVERHLDAMGEDPAIVVVPCLPAVAHRVPLAGDEDVVVTVEAQQKAARGRGRKREAK